MGKDESRSVAVHYARDEFEAQEVEALLQENEIPCAVEREWNAAWDGLTGEMKGYYAKISVLEPEAERAKELIADYLAGEGKA